MELETEEGRSHPSCCVLARLCFVCLVFGLCGTRDLKPPCWRDRRLWGGCEPLVCVSSLALGLWKWFQSCSRLIASHLLLFSPSRGFTASLTPDSHPATSFT